MAAIQTILNAISGTVLILALVAGLVNFPTTCSCGAEVPHGHSLFILDQHHHHSDRHPPYQSSHTADTASHDHGAGHAEPVEAPHRAVLDLTDGPQLQAPAGASYAGSQIAVNLVVIQRAGGAGLDWQPTGAIVPPAGHDRGPEPPPPRVVPVGLGRA